MRIEEKKVESFVIYDAPALDPVLVVLDNMGHGRGKLIVECFGSTWSTYWGAIGDCSLREFIISCSPDYIQNRMWSPEHKRLKRHEHYLTRIVVAVQSALRASENCKATL